MRPKTNRKERAQGDLFRARLDQVLNMEHRLTRLAKRIDWEVLEETFGALYVENKERPGLPIRLMVGRHYMKHTFGESDETVVERVLEETLQTAKRGGALLGHVRGADRQQESGEGTSGSHSVDEETLGHRETARIWISTPAR